MLHLKITYQENRCCIVQKLQKKKIQPQNVCYSYKILTKLANNPETLQSFYRDLADSKNLFLLRILIFLKDIQLNRTKGLQHHLSLKDVGHPFSDWGGNFYWHYRHHNSV